MKGKKLLSMLLVLVMVCTIIPVQAFLSTGLSSGELGNATDFATNVSIASDPNYSGLVQVDLNIRVNESVAAAQKEIREFSSVLKVDAEKLHPVSSARTSRGQSTMSSLLEGSSIGSAPDYALSKSQAGNSFAIMANQVENYNWNGSSYEPDDYDSFNIDSSMLSYNASTGMLYINICGLNVDGILFNENSYVNVATLYLKPTEGTSLEEIRSAISLCSPSELQSSSDGCPAPSINSVASITSTQIEIEELPQSNVSLHFSADFPQPQVSTYTIFFVGESGELLQESTVQAGETPVYTGTTPSKAADDMYTYTFAGWSPEIAPVSGDMTYTATFSQEHIHQYAASVTAPTCTEQGYTTYTCAACGDSYVDDYTAALGHDFGAWAVTTPEVLSTATQTGTTAVETRTCSRCDAAETRGGETTPALGEGAMRGFNYTLTVETTTGVPNGKDNEAPKITLFGKPSKGTGTESPIVQNSFHTDYIATASTYTCSGFTDKFPSKLTLDIRFDILGFRTWNGNITLTLNGETVISGSYSLMSSLSNFASRTLTVTLPDYSVDRVVEFPHTVRFVDDTGTVMQEGMYATGATPICMSNWKAPSAQYSYTFAGWEPEIVPVSEDTTYTASFDATVNEYNINFSYDNVGDNSLNYTTLKKYTLPYGAMPVYDGPTPTHPATTSSIYTFSGWSPEIDTVTGSKTYRATFTSSPRPYTIRFVNADGTELQSSQVAYGSTPAYNGTTPSKEATAQSTYTFAGWSPSITSVTGNKTYTATYTATGREYNITFISANDAQSYMVVYGETPVPPEVFGYQSGDYDYSFAGWDKDVVPVTGDATYTACYYSTFISADYTEYYNAVAAATEKRDNGSWTEESLAVLNAALNTDVSNKGRSEQGVVDAQAAAINAAADALVQKVESYTIRFVDEDGTELQSGSVEAGETPAYNGETPTKEATAAYTYTFAGWNPEIAPVSGNATYTATYTQTARSYTITFVDEDGTELQSGQVAYGETPAYNGETPAKAATAAYTYTFAGWSPNIAPVSGNATYTATYTQTARSYTIRFVDEGGTELQSSQMAYGATPVYTGSTPEKMSDGLYTYTFAGWSPEIAPVSGDTTYTATFSQEHIHQYAASVTAPTCTEGGYTTYTCTQCDDSYVADYTDALGHDWGEWTVTTPAVAATPDAAGSTAVETRECSRCEATETRGGEVIPVLTDCVAQVGDNYYTTLQSAFSAVPSSGGTVKLLCDYSFAENAGSLTINNKSVTLDMNGYSIDCSNITDTYFITIGSGTFGTGTLIVTGEGDIITRGQNKMPFAVCSKANNAPGTSSLIIGKDVTVSTDDNYAVLVFGRNNRADGAYVEINGTLNGGVYVNGLISVHDVNTPVIKINDGAVINGGDVGIYGAGLATWDIGSATISGNTGIYFKSGSLTIDGATVLGKGQSAAYTAWDEGYNSTGEALVVENNSDYAGIGTVSVLGGDFSTVDPNASAVGSYVNDSSVTRVVGFIRGGHYSSNVSEFVADGYYYNSESGYVLEDTRATIRFLDEDGTELQSSQVAYGETPVYNGATPTKAATAQYSYTFNGWSPSITSVTKNQDYTATYTATGREYTVTFIDASGMHPFTVAYGETPVPPEVFGYQSGDYDYSFAGWDKDVVPVTGDATYTACYYSTFISADYTEYYNAVATATEKRDNGSWTEESLAVLNAALNTDVSHKGRSKQDVVDAQAAAINAAADALVQKVESYTIRFVDEDGTELQSGSVEAGETPVYNGETPTKEATAAYTYTFAGWNPEVAPVSGDATYTATYTQTARSYTIRFVGEDGTELQSSQVAYGSTPAYNGTTPKKMSDGLYTYTFAGWSPEIAPVSGDTTYTATFSQEHIHQYAASVTAPTCTEGGYTTYTCTQCDDSYVADYTDALGHDFGAWAITTPEVSATATEAGSTAVETRTCSRCDATETRGGEVIPATGAAVEDDSGEYYVRVTYKVTKSGTFTANYGGFNTEVEDSAGISLLYKDINGTAADYKVQDWDIKSSMASNGTYTADATVSGFPYLLYGYADDNKFMGSAAEFTINKLEVGSSASDLQEVWNGNIQLSTIKNGYGVSVDWDDTQKADYFDRTDKDNFIDSSSGAWEKPYAATMHTAYEESEVRLNAQEDAIRNSLTYEAFDQYGVKMGSSLCTVTTTDSVSDNAQYIATSYEGGNGQTTVQKAAHLSGEGNNSQTIVATCAWAGKDTTQSDSAQFTLLDEQYTITWLSGGDTLSEKFVCYGDTPVYDGTQPQKPADEMYTYTFDGWSPDIMPATQDTAYTAVFSQTHEHHYRAEVTAPTCTEQGYTTYTCTAGDDSYVADYTAALGHDFGEWSVTTPAVPATATEAGSTAVETRTCSRCDATETRGGEVIPATGGETPIGAYTYEVTIETTNTTDPKSDPDITMFGKLPNSAEEAEIFNENIDETYVSTYTTYTKTGSTDKLPSKMVITIPFESNGVLSALGWGANVTVKVNGVVIHNQAHELISRDGNELTIIFDYDPETIYIYDVHYIVQYFDDDGTILQEGSYNTGDTPTYNGQTPTKEPSGNHRYVFKGWDKEVTSVTGPAIYRAQYHDCVGEVTEPTCTEQGYTTYTCVEPGCSYTFKEDYVPALGHNMKGVVTKPTCTTDGKTTYTCTRCGYSYDADIVPAPGHRFGGWVVVKAPTIYETGLKQRKCQRYQCSATQEEIIPKLENPDDLCRTYFTVVSAATGSPISGAKITVSVPDYGSVIGTTNAQGEATLEIPRGSYQATIVKSGYETRNVHINVTHDQCIIAPIGLYNQSLCDISLTATELNYDEIVAAGIDVNDPANNHICKTSFVIQIDPDEEPITGDFYVNDENETVLATVNVYNEPGKKGKKITRIASKPDEPHGVPTGLDASPYGYSIVGDRFRISTGDRDIDLWQLSDGRYLLIENQVKWLKEIFDVRLIVVNRSVTDTMTNMTAELFAPPSGLSLAAGVNQSSKMDLGTIAPGEFAEAHWYVRGDEAGSYGLAVNIEGEYEGFGDEVKGYQYMPNAIEVLDDDDLSLSISIPNTFTKSGREKVTITLTNTSFSRTYYGVGSLITYLQEFEIKHLQDGTVVQTFYGGGETEFGEFANEFGPGDQIVIEVYADQFMSSMLLQNNQGNFADYAGATNDNIAARAQKVGAMEGFDNLLAQLQAADEMNSSQKEQIGRFRDVANTFKNNVQKNPCGPGYLNLSGVGELLDEYEQMSDYSKESAVAWYSSKSADEINQAIRKMEALNEYMSQTEQVNKALMFDTVRDTSIDIPVSLMMDTIWILPNEGAASPLNPVVTVGGTCEDYYGVSLQSKALEQAKLNTYGESRLGTNSVNSQLESVDIATAAGKTYEITAVQGEATVFDAKDTTGALVYTVSTDNPSAFSISTNNASAQQSGGETVFTGEAVVSVTPQTNEGGTVVIEDSLGNTYTYHVTVVEAHECTAGERQILAIPTETTTGMAVRTCSVCGEILDVEILEAAACEHTFGQWETMLEGDCEQGAMQYRECETCGELELQEIAAAGHDYEAVVTEPTCEEPGFTTYTCSRCEDSYVADTVEALGHDFGEWTVTTAPTCTEAGEETRTCSRDASHTETRTVEALGHSYEAVVTAPTCEAEGFTTYTCSVCGDSYVADTVEALGHDFGEWTVTTEPTCTEAGEETRTCSRDASHTETRTVEALGHSYEAVVTAPTCEAEGFTTYTCSVCGDSYVADTVEALGHDFGEWTVTTAPTCTEAGEETRTCSRDASHTETRTVEALGHSYEAVVTAPTCEAEGFTTHTCTRCEDSYTDTPVAALGHEWSNWSTTVEPTCTEAGEQSRVCTRDASHIETKPIAALGHDFSDNAQTCKHGCGTTNPEYLPPQVEPQAPGAFVMTEAKTRAGKTITVDINIARNPGITALSIDIVYPQQLTLTNVEYSSLFSSAPSNSNRYSSPFTISWYSSGSMDENDTGLFATLTFTIDEGVPAGDYPVTINYDAENIFNIAFEDQAFDITNGLVKVVDSLPGDVNSDGKVNMKDIVLLQQFINHWEVTIDDIAANVNGDSKVNMKDLVLIQQFINGWEVELR